MTTLSGNTRAPLSVVMPTLNQAGFIRRAIESVMAQDIPGLELLVQDGGSTDGTLEILAELAESHPGLRWVSEPDNGPADALNRALARAQGDVIGWLNSDDLYAPGAASRALAALRRHPEHVMVYGHAEHVDEIGTVLAPYLTLEPAAALVTAAEGCHICQPTVFFRREVLERLGGLDTTLRTAFDFDFWLRLLKAYPQRVGFVTGVQARSRLHAGAITQRLREQVALEGMEVVCRHIGPASANWLLTHFEEVMETLPIEGATAAPAMALLHLVEQSAAWLSEGGAQELRAYLANHRALQLAKPDLFAHLSRDGWTLPNLTLRLRQATQPYESLSLGGRHASPRGGVLLLQVVQPDGETQAFEVAGQGPFQLSLPIHDRRPGAKVVLQVQCLNPFVPAKLEPGSDDHRELGFQIETLELLPRR